MQTRAAKRLRVQEELKESKVDRLSLLPTDLALGVFQFLDPRAHVRLGWQSKQLRRDSLAEHSWCWRHRVLELIGLYSASSIGANWNKARELIAAAPASCPERAYCNGELLLATVDCKYAKGAYNFKEAIAEFKRAADQGHWWARYKHAKYLPQTKPFEKSTGFSPVAGYFPGLLYRASNGDIAAQAEVARQRGTTITDPEIVKLIEHYRWERDVYNSGKNGPPQLAYRASRLFSKGQCEESVKLLKQAGELGLVRAWNRAGDELRWLGEAQEADECYRRGAAAGHFDCMFVLGWQQLEMMKKAAALGSACACYRMVMWLETGIVNGVAADQTQAAKYRDMYYKLSDVESESEEEDEYDDEEEEYTDGDDDEDEYDDNEEHEPVVALAGDP